ncbi:hypothetical protein INT48_009861 [Thamnidium elegans]|uniref:Uncharacterized protein n=1 Tax=Thamnidium elegans TaxID=101142 RepID=A0A8H7VSJ0_9FUNG|nr:hypothetical protein INT48_009861 [Thamnidium elegans]
MPQTKSHKEKYKSPTYSSKPIPGKIILNIVIGKENVGSVSNNYLSAPVSGWTSPSKLVNSLKTETILKSGPQQALDNIRNSLKNIGDSDSVNDQLSRYAANCHKYSQKPKFSEEFKNLYSAKSGLIQDCFLKERSHMLSLKAKGSATAITDKALDLIKESTLREMDNEIDVDQNELAEKEAANIDTEEFMGPARTINHLSDQPKLQAVHIESVKNKCFIAISSTSLFLIPPFLREVLENNQANQKVLMYCALLSI